MSYDNDSNGNDEETVLNMIRAPKMPSDLKDAMERMMII
jgi:hypothetical protein